MSLTAPEDKASRSHPEEGVHGHQQELGKLSHMEKLQPGPSLVLTAESSVTTRASRPPGAPHEGGGFLRMKLILWRADDVKLYSPRVGNTAALCR